MNILKRGHIALFAYLVISICTGVLLGEQTALHAQAVEQIPAQVCQFPQNRALLSYAAEDAVHPAPNNPPLTLTTPIPAGTYTIHAKSFEDHIGSNDPTQPIEQWQILLYGAGGLVYSSGFTDDIPDDIDENITEIGSEVSLPEITAIRYAHIAYATGLEDAQFGGQAFDALSPEQKSQVVWNSVEPSCIEFSLVNETNDPDAITCRGITLTRLEDMSYKATAELSADITGQVDSSFTLLTSEGEVILEQNVGGLEATFQLEPGEFIIEASIVGEDFSASCQTDIQVAEDGGSVLGVSTDGESRDSDDNSTGHVLAATGSPAIALVLTGGMIIAAAVISRLLTAREATGGIAIVENMQ